jgi:UDP-N-acetylmuramoyl-tripeptide--D-alanyl-D-alanine ligase
MELLGSQQAIATAKAELVKAIPESGLVLLNGDDAWSRELAKASAAPVSFYGVEEGNDVYARDLTVDEHGHPSFTLVSAAGSVAVAMAVPGRHNAYNATASAAVGLHLGLTLRQIAEGLENASMTPMRMEVFESADGVTVINDAYNANPTSMRAALRTLADMSDDGRRVAVIGDMAELGSLTELAHFEVGERVARLGLERLVTVGHLARRMGEGALAEGMDPGAVTSFDTVEAAVEFLRETLRSGDTVLVKASRSMGLERVVEGIIKADV